MSNEIKVGYLVMVVRGMPCCGANTGAEGVPFKVTRLEYFDNERRCNYCRADRPAIYSAHGFIGRRAIEITRLIRIDPPALPESVTTDERITA